jgi:hypothetical protein
MVDRLPPAAAAARATAVALMKLLLVTSLETVFPIL